MFTTKNLLLFLGRNVIISLVVIFITVTASLFISKEINKISDSTALNHRLGKELAERIEFLKTLKQDIKIIGTNDTKIEGAFTPSDNILEFINTLDNLASKNNLTQVYRFETPVPSTISAIFPIETISYSNNFQTNLSTFSSYLKEFEKLPYFTTIKGFSISSQDKLGWSGLSNVSFNATLYTKVIQ